MTGPSVDIGRDLQFFAVPKVKFALHALMYILYLVVMVSGA